MPPRNASEDHHLSRNLVGIQDPVLAALDAAIASPERPERELPVEFQPSEMDAVLGELDLGDATVESELDDLDLAAIEALIEHQLNAANAETATIPTGMQEQLSDDDLACMEALDANESKAGALAHVEAYMSGRAISGRRTIATPRQIEIDAYRAGKGKLAWNELKRALYAGKIRETEGRPVREYVSGLDDESKAKRRKKLKQKSGKKCRANETLEQAEERRRRNAERTKEKRAKAKNPNAHEKEQI